MHQNFYFLHGQFVRVPGTIYKKAIQQLMKYFQKLPYGIFLFNFYR